MHDNFSGRAEGMPGGGPEREISGKHMLHVNFMQFVMFYVPRLLMGANVTPGNLKMTDFNLYNLFY